MWSPFFSNLTHTPDQNGSNWSKNVPKCVQVYEDTKSLWCVWNFQGLLVCVDSFPSCVPKRRDDCSYLSWDLSFRIQVHTPGQKMFKLGQEHVPVYEDTKSLWCVWNFICLLVCVDSFPSCVPRRRDDCSYLSWDLSFRIKVHTPGQKKFKLGQERVPVYEDTKSLWCVWNFKRLLHCVDSFPSCVP